ncbi:MAG: LysM peptidoglycan-binding domain-containing protein [Nitrospirae bacterium]|nr:LysM peptidoglycan-binding domain-containing protein [Nitrospirota bacterium]
MMNFGRRWLSALTFIAMTLWAAPWINSVSWGQETPSTTTSEPASADENSTAETPTPTEETPAPPEEVTPSKPGTVTVPETTTGPRKYTVKPRDTLWGISNAYLQDSFLWPKVWKNNQYIINPDLIYPGNVIDLPGGEAAQLEARVETAQPASSPSPRVVEEAAPPPEREKPVEITPPEQPVPAAKPIEMKLLAASGYILTGQSPAGVVVAGRDGRELNGAGDTAYVLPKDGSQPRVGDRYTVYRSVHKVYHPKTGQYLGDLIRILGQAEITGADPEEKTVTSKVITSYDAIHPGDFLMSTPTPEDSVDQTTPPPPSGPLEGFIVEVKEDRVDQSQFDVVYLDRGRQQGVRSGDRYAIVRAGEKTSYFSPGKGVRLPRRIIGELQVISVQDATATAKVLKSTEVIYKGDHFETPPAP